MGAFMLENVLDFLVSPPTDYALVSPETDTFLALSVAVKVPKLQNLGELSQEDLEDLKMELNIMMYVHSVTNKVLTC